MKYYFLKKKNKNEHSLLWLSRLSASFSWPAYFNVAAVADVRLDLVAVDGLAVL
jgi:hypothetical protein